MCTEGAVRIDRDGGENLKLDRRGRPSPAVPSLRILGNRPGNGNFTPDDSLKQKPADASYQDLGFVIDPPCKDGGN